MFLECSSRRPQHGSSSETHKYNSFWIPEPVASSSPNPFVLGAIANHPMILNSTGTTSPVLFFERGYDLFRPRSGGMLSVSNGTPSPALDFFELYGDRGNTFRSLMRRVS